MKQTFNELHSALVFSLNLSFFISHFLIDDKLDIPRGIFVLIFFLLFSVRENLKKNVNYSLIVKLLCTTSTPARWGDPNTFFPCK